MQRLTCTGRITQNLELRYTNDNKPILYIPIAVINSNKEAKPLYLNFITYGEVAKIHHQYLTKGSTIYIEGHIYQTVREENGKNKRYDNYYADKIEYINVKKEAPKKSGEEVPEQVVDNMSRPQQEESDPFKDFGEEIHLSDDDLPF